MSRITVIGMDGGPLREEARTRLQNADLVAGGERHLAKLGVEPERAAILKGDLSEAMDRVETSEGPVVVLASGDPGFFGIVRLLTGRFDAEELLILPAPSSISETFARAGLPWDDAVVVSVHGREPRRAVNVCKAHPKVAVLTSPEFGPADLARELGGTGRTLFVAERLGEPDERVYSGDVAKVAGMDWEYPNVVVVVDGERAVGEKGWISSGIGSPGRWALPESEFEHRSAMITKPEVRSLVLARLGPGPGDLVWDVGAGSGSVAVECARLGAAVVAVERDSESCARILRNADRHGVYVRIVEGEAPDALRELPEPDAVFVGGTGAFEEIVKLAAVRACRTVVLTLITLERVLPAGKILEDCGYDVQTTYLQASRMKGVGDLHRLAAASPVFVVAGSRP